MAEYQDTENSSYCYNVTEVIRQMYMANGITSLICFILLLPTLVIESCYIWRYTTTFPQRFFFYLTIAATVLVGIWAVVGMVTTVLSPQELNSCWWVISDCLIYYAYFLELSMTFSLNIILLIKIFKYTWAGRMNCPTLFSCCSQRHKEFAFVLFHFMLGLIAAAAAGLFAVWEEMSEVTTITFLYIPALSDIVLSLLCILILIVWFCVLRRKGLLSRRLKLVCREMSLILGFLVLFLVLWGLLACFQLYQLVTRAQALYTLGLFVNILFPIVHIVVPLPFFVYMCVTFRQRRKNKDTITHQPTVPPSTRVSLPSDTAAHAPNFLSPSTAGPSEETPLIQNS